MLKDKATPQLLIEVVIREARPREAPVYTSLTIRMIYVTRSFHFVFESRRRVQIGPQIKIDAEHHNLGVTGR